MIFTDVARARARPRAEDRDAAQALAVTRDQAQVLVGHLDEVERVLVGVKELDERDARSREPDPSDRPCGPPVDSVEKGDAVAEASTGDHVTDFARPARAPLGRSAQVHDGF